jgi:serine protease inhibitor
MYSQFICFQLGLTDVFTTKSDLGGITSHDQTLSVSDIVQKAELEVNEKGGTASAASGISLLYHA